MWLRPTNIHKISITTLLERKNFLAHFTIVLVFAEIPHSAYCSTSDDDELTTSAIFKMATLAIQYGFMKRIYALQ
jgi:hypothetical protein